MVQCSRAVGGEWLERMPKVSMMTHWGSPSWAILTVHFLIHSFLIRIYSVHFAIVPMLIFVFRRHPELGGSVVGQAAAALRSLSRLLKPRFCTEGTQRPECHRMSRNQSLCCPTKTETASIERRDLNQKMVKS